MELKLDGKLALVCASSAGIGKAIAKGLYAEGADVVILGRDKQKLENAEKEIRASGTGKLLAVTCDLRDPKSVDSMLTEVAKLGSPQILVHNQGGPAPGSIENLGEEQIRSAVETNIYSVMRITKALIPGMKASGWGRIVHVLSVSAKESLPNMLLSNMVRPAVVGFSKTIAQEYAPFGITSNCVLPAAVLTQRSLDFMGQRAAKENKTLDQIRMESAKSIPIGRQASPEEFAQTALFLCSEPAAYVTGTAIAVDGGFTRSIL